MNQSSSEPWTHQIGVLAWAPLPQASGKKSPSKRNSNIGVCTDQKQISQQGRGQGQGHTNMWPCILYPSWSRAVKLSCGLLSNEKKIQIIGVKNPTSVDDLARNRVPSRVALGEGFLVDGKYFRKRVVAHFLGMGDHPCWAPINADCLQQYTLQSCKDRLIAAWRENKNASGEESKNNFEEMERLVLAMTESSIVAENGTFDPNLLYGQLGIMTGQGQDDGDEDDDTTMLNDCTPEFFDDWKLGGISQEQKRSQSQTQNFSQGAFSVPVGGGSSSLTRAR